MLKVLPPSIFAPFHTPVARFVQGLVVWQDLVVGWRSALPVSVPVNGCPLRALLLAYLPRLPTCLCDIEQVAAWVGAALLAEVRRLVASMAHP
jgi:hypothetical protein